MVNKFSPFQFIIIFTVSTIPNFCLSHETDTTPFSNLTDTSNIKRLSSGRSISFGGPITNNTTWSADRTPYIIDASVLVKQGVSLTIEPGVEVRFNPGLTLQVDGKLIARGTVANLIVFTSNQPAPAPGDWGHIQFTASSLPANFDTAGNYTGGSILQHAVVEYGGSSTAGMVSLVNTAPFINQCVVRHSATSGIRISTGNTAFLTRITHNLIAYNRTMHAPWTGGGIHVEGEAVVTDNALIDNYAESDGGGIMAYTSGTSKIAYNTLIGNRSNFNGGGITVNGTADVSGNFIAANAGRYGGGIAYFTCVGGTVTSNTLVDNTSTEHGGALGSGIYVDQRCGAIVLVHNNNFGANLPYDLYNASESAMPAVNAKNNWWGITDSTEIVAKIYDRTDNSNVGTVDYNPFLITADINALPSPPTDFVATPGETTIHLRWSPNPEADTAGYNVYYDSDVGFPFVGTGANEGDSPINVGNVAEFTLSGLSLVGVAWRLALTVYDADGNESWFSNIVAIQPANNPPIIIRPIGQVHVDEDSNDFSIDLSTVFDDVDIITVGDKLSLTLETNTNTGLVSPSLSGDELTLIFLENQNGTANITVRATDLNGPAFVEDTFTVIVDPVNDQPRLEPIGNRSLNEDSLVSFIVQATDPDEPPNNLTFSLDQGAPEGVGIDPISGVFNWVPAEHQGPGTYNITVRVTDDGTPALDDGETIAITVNEVNSTPLLDTIGDKSVNEGFALIFTAAATDPDEPPNNLTFSLDQGAPEGVGIDPISGVFNWVPAERQGPGTYNITVRVTDDGTPALDDVETIAITVNEVNSAPLLDTIGNKSVNEGFALIFTAMATDFDEPFNNLTFSLDQDAPEGTGIDPKTGVFIWVPTEHQGPGTYNITVRVTDDGSPALEDFERVTITVNAVNNAPVLDIIGDKSVIEGFPLTFTASVTDPDEPPDNLTFSLDHGAPEGAGIDPNSGVFNWVPTEHQAPGTYNITVRVTDDGSPVLDDFETITITVNPLSLDIDGNRALDPLTDGLLILRYLFGFRGNDLVNNTVGQGCIRCTSTMIEQYLNTLTGNTGQN